MKVVILCGGLGTRLREETEFRPKPMVPIGGRPILWHIMKTYAHYGHTEFILCLGYKGEVIKDYFRHYYWNTCDVTIRLSAHPAIKYHSSHDEEDWTVTMLDTGQNTQTGGRLKRALAHVPDDEFLFTYGDGLIRNDINATVDFHRAHGGLATLTAIQPGGRFGELAIAGAQVSSFREKPVTRDNDYVSGGYFVMNKAIGDYLTGDDCILERRPLQQLAEDGKLHAYKHHGYWQCMDTYREYVMLNESWDNGTAEWKVW